MKNLASAVAPFSTSCFLLHSLAALGSVFLLPSADIGPDRIQLLQTSIPIPTPLHQPSPPLKPPLPSPVFVPNRPLLPTVC